VGNQPPPVNGGPDWLNALTPRVAAHEGVLDDARPQKHAAAPPPIGGGSVIRLETFFYAILAVPFRPAASGNFQVMVEARA
jgi:hypothetical protein